MPIRAAASAASSMGGGGTIICSHHHHRHFLSLKGVSSNIIPTYSSSSSLLTTQSPIVYKPNLNLKFICRAADATPQPSSNPININKSIVTDDEFSLAKVSFGVIGLYGGVSLLSYGFGAYFNILPGSEWSAIMLTYGFPLAIIGMALKYAELKPVPCLTYSDAQVLREKCATPILKQVRDDVIRYRYGDEQHLEEALKRIFQYGLGGGIPRRSAPTLQLIREEVTEDGKYCLVLVFEAKDLQLSDFEKRQAKFTSFFGPGITAEVDLGGNPSTSFMLVFALIAGAIGECSVLLGFTHLRAWRTDSLAAAASSAILSWAITALTFGLVCKEIIKGGHRGKRLQTLEAFITISALSQLMYLLLLHAGMLNTRYGPTYGDNSVYMPSPILALT